MKRLAVDIGGTFTDSVYIDDDRKLHIDKTPSTPEDFAKGVINGIERLDLDVSELDIFIHGATTVLNALVEKKVAEVGLITTEGFRDALEMMRWDRDPHIYDYTVKKSEPWVPRHLRKEVDERILKDGEVHKELDEEEARQVVRELKEAGVDAVAICLIHGYANSIHEEKIESIVKEEFPEAYVSCSHKVAPEYKEFERTSSTVINSATGPVLDDYLSRLSDALEDKEYKKKIYAMQSNGGLIREDEARKTPITTIMSGPVGGVVGGVHLSNMLDNPNVITLDMGGTTADIALIENHEANYSTKIEVKDEQGWDKWPVLAPTIDVTSIGAGGGSIAWVDVGDVWKVGPKSAGADPGPACYGQGGTEPTVTDANLLAGRMNPDYFLGGEMDVDVEAAKKALGKIGDVFDIDLHEVSSGILEIVVSNMAREIRTSCAEEGYDYSEAALMAFGGAGQLHATDLAKELNISTVVAPYQPGSMSAMGMLVSDFRYDASKTWVHPTEPSAMGRVNEIYKELEAETLDNLESQGVSNEKVSLTRTCDIRYAGQEYVINTPIPQGELTGDQVEKIVRNYNDLHERQRGHCNRDEDTQFVTFRVVGRGVVEKPYYAEKEEGEASPCEEAIKGKRKAYSSEVQEFIEHDIYEWEKLKPNNSFSGPAIVEDPRTTLYLSGNEVAKVDSHMNIIIEVG